MMNTKKIYNLNLQEVSEMLIRFNVKNFLSSVWNHLDNMSNTTYYNYKEEGAY